MTTVIIWKDCVIFDDINYFLQAYFCSNNSKTRKFPSQLSMLGNLLGFSCFEMGHIIKFDSIGRGFC